MAQELGIACVEDEDAPSRVADVDAVVVGADAVGSEAFVNKVGTRALAEAAAATSTPFFVVVESYKWVDCARPVAGEDAFETVANRFVTVFLTDDMSGVSLHHRGGGSSRIEFGSGIEQ